MRAIYRKLRFITQNPLPFLFHHPPSSSYSFSSLQSDDLSPRLFVVQPRFRPDSLLKTKLNEALNLANSLEQHRDNDDNMYHATDKEPPRHIVVQNPAYRITRAGRLPLFSYLLLLLFFEIVSIFMLSFFLWFDADTFFGPGTLDNIKCHLNAHDSNVITTTLFFVLLNF